MQPYYFVMAMVRVSPKLPRPFPSIPLPVQRSVPAVSATVARQSAAAHLVRQNSAAHVARHPVAAPPPPATRPAANAKTQRAPILANHEFHLNPRDTIVQALTATSNDDVSAATIKLSLRCPLSYARMTKPIRFNKCSHLQCIEEASWKSYCSSLHKRATLKCPLCSKPVAHSYDGFIDGFTLEILTGSGEGVDEVLIETESKFAWTPVASAVGIEVADAPAVQVVCAFESESDDDDDQSSLATTGVVLHDDDGVQVLDLTMPHDASSGRPSIPLKRSGNSVDDAIIL